MSSFQRELRSSQFRNSSGKTYKYTFSLYFSSVTLAQVHNFKIYSTSLLTSFYIQQHSSPRSENISTTLITMKQTKNRLLEAADSDDNQFCKLLFSGRHAFWAPRMVPSAQSITQLNDAYASNCLKDTKDHILAREEIFQITNIFERNSVSNNLYRGTPHADLASHERSQSNPTNVSNILREEYASKELQEFEHQAGKSCADIISEPHSENNAAHITNTLEEAYNSNELQTFKHHTSFVGHQTNHNPAHISIILNEAYAANDLRTAKSHAGSISARNAPHITTQRNQTNFSNTLTKAKEYNNAHRTRSPIHITNPLNKVYALNELESLRHHTEAFDTRSIPQITHRLNESYFSNVLNAARNHTGSHKSRSAPYITNALNETYFANELHERKHHAGRLHLRSSQVKWTSSVAATRPLDQAQEPRTQFQTLSLVLIGLFISVAMLLYFRVVRSNAWQSRKEKMNLDSEKGGGNCITATKAGGDKCVAKVGMDRN